MASRAIGRVRKDRFTVEGRAGLVPGTYKPDGSTAGYMPGVGGSRTNYNGVGPGSAGTFTLTTNGAVYNNVDFYGDVIVQASNVTFNNCRFYGSTGHPASNRGCATLTGLNNHSNVIFNDCLAEAQYPSYYRDGWVGNNYKAYRCEARGINDGFGAFSNPSGAGDCNVELYGIYVHDLVFWLQDPAHAPIDDADGTHNDCVQYQGGDHFILLGGNLIGNSSDAAGSTGPNPRAPHSNGSALTFNQNTDAATDCLIDKTWMNFGQALLNVPSSSFGAPAGLTLGDNWYGPDVFNHSTSGSTDMRWVAVKSGYQTAIPGMLTKQRFEVPGDPTSLAGDLLQVDTSSPYTLGIRLV